MHRSSTRTRSLYSSSLAGIGLFSVLASVVPALAAGSEPESIETVIVTGTRTGGMKAEDSAAPIQIINSDVLATTGQQDVMQALSQNVPSFNAQGYGEDTAGLIMSISLRGLNPNDTLVLINGKRRHSTANLAFDGGSPYQGAATTDLTFVPMAAIDHIEVLQDGAAAQYGSDAIAGVVNIITKKASSGGLITATGGQYYQGDGATAASAINKGFALGDAGYLNVTLEQRYHDFSRQGGADARFYNPDGTLRSDLSAINTTNIPLAPDAPLVNNIYGDSTYQLYDGFYDAGYKVGGVDFYSFGSFGHRNIRAYENYRAPDKISGVTSTGATVYPLPYGFSPLEGIKEDDYSFTGGAKGALGGWSWDLSTTYGEDRETLSTLDSANQQLFPVLQALSATPIVPQRNFADGAYDASAWTTNLDIARDFDLGLASPLTLAFGGEAADDTYAISAGEPSSYYGAGAQSFPGYSPADAGSHSRTAYAAYLDIEASLIKGLFVAVAGRYEHYSDFGDAKVGKVTARYDFSPAFAVRGTISTGFRAPTLQEEYYSGTNVSPSYAQVQLPPNSPAALLAGFGPLKPELSHNYSAGFVAHAGDDLQFTLDAYEIDISNRIVGSGFLLGSVLDQNTTPASQTVISQAVLNAITAHGSILDPNVSYAGIQLFTNGVNTRTRGVEAMANYSTDFASAGHVDWTLGVNYNETSITKLAPLPAADYNASVGQTTLLTPYSTSALTTAMPKFKVVLDAFWRSGKWTVNLREDIYGPTSLWVSPAATGAGPNATLLKISTEGVTDLDIGYKITEDLKVDIGANNLFDLRPPTVPYIPGVGMVDGNNVYNEPDQFSPFGINGGYFYGRVTITL